MAISEIITRRTDDFARYRTEYTRSTLDWNAEKTLLLEQPFAVSRFRRRVVRRIVCIIGYDANRE